MKHLYDTHPVLLEQVKHMYIALYCSLNKIS